MTTEYRSATGEPDTDLGSLLEPSLDSSAAPAQPLFSVRASLLVAFFGGVWAAAVFCGANALRVGKARADWWILAAVALAWSVFLFWASYRLALGTSPEWLDLLGNPGRTVRFAGKVLAMALAGGFSWRYRPLFMGQALAGVEPASPWRMAALSIGLSIAISMGVALAAMGLARG